MQLKDPRVLLQAALTSQLCASLVHSSTSKTTKGIQLENVLLKCCTYKTFRSDVVFGSVLYGVSRDINVTLMRPHNWLITACIINEFENNGFNKMHEIKDMNSIN